MHLETGRTFIGQNFLTRDEQRDACVKPIAEEGRVIAKNIGCRASLPRGKGDKAKVK